MCFTANSSFLCASSRETLIFISRSPIPRFFRNASVGNPTGPPTIRFTAWSTWHGIDFQIRHERRRSLPRTHTVHHVRRRGYPGQAALVHGDFLPPHILRADTVHEPFMCWYQRLVRLDTDKRAILFHHFSNPMPWEALISTVSPGLQNLVYPSNRLSPGPLGNRDFPALGLSFPFPSCFPWLPYRYTVGSAFLRR